MEEKWVHFTAPTRVHIESDSIYKVGQFIQGFGTRALIISIRKESSNSEQLAMLENGIKKYLEGSVTYEDIQNEANTEQVDSASYFAKNSHIDLVVAYGGVETIQVAKVVALLANNSVFCADLLNGEAKVTNKPFPLVVIPSQPTLGEEMSPDSSIIVAETGDIKYYSNYDLFPVACFYDVKVTRGLLPEDIAKIGAGMIAYCIENLLSIRSNIIGQTILIKVIENIRKLLPKLYNEPSNEKLMSQLLWASSMIGVAASTSSFGVAYALSKSLKTDPTVDYHLALGILLPHVMEYYLTAAPKHFLSIATSLGEETEDISIIEAAIKAVEGVRKLFMAVNLPTRLSDFDLKKHQLGGFADIAITFPQVASAPRKLTKNELESILLAAF